MDDLRYAIGLGQPGGNQLRSVEWSIPQVLSGGPSCLFLIRYYYSKTILLVICLFIYLFIDLSIYLVIYLVIYLLLLGSLSSLCVWLAKQIPKQILIMTRFDQPTKPWTMMVLPGGLQEVWLCTPSGESQRGGQKNWGKKTAKLWRCLSASPTTKKGNSTVKTGWFYQQWGPTKVSWNELPDFTNKRWFL